MQISQNLLRVIFMLSTIVAVTDCCSSRILFLKEQTLNIIQERKMQQYQEYIDQEATNEQYGQLELGGHVNSDKAKLAGDEMAEITGTDKPPPPQEKGGGGAGGLNFGQQFSELLLKDAALNSKKQHNKHEKPPGYQLIDIYQSIMDNVLSFACTGQFLTDFCLNGGRCFRVPMGNQSLFSCECADGYVGERCESKSVNGVFVLSSALDNRKPKILTARIVFSFPMLILLTVIYLFFGMAIVFKCQPPFRAKYTPQDARAAGLLLT